MIPHSRYKSLCSLSSSNHPSGITSIANFLASGANLECNISDVTVRRVVSSVSVIEYTSVTRLNCWRWMLPRHEPESMTYYESFLFLDNFIFCLHEVWFIIIGRLQVVCRQPFIWSRVFLNTVVFRSRLPWKLTHWNSHAPRSGGLCCLWKGSFKSHSIPNVNFSVLYSLSCHVYLLCVCVNIYLVCLSLCLDLLDDPYP
jgi:hypothetical protein